MPLKTDLYLKIRFGYRVLRSLHYKVRINSVGKRFVLLKPLRIEGLKWAEIGHYVEIQEQARIEIFGTNESKGNQVKLSIGNNVSINPRVHIGCIRRITIGDNCLLASNVYITDHSHGEVDFNDIETPPSQRAIKSKGPVVIEENVWLGENSVVLPNVTIGRNSVIGANTVVTKSIPPYSVAAGVPARIIQTLGTT
jgi:acetyltransferase-like isoleucine patch superfamily enzyme